MKHNTYEPYIPQNMSVYEYLLKTGTAHLNKTAITFYGKRYTYEAMFDAIDTVADALIKFGIKKDDVVASSLPGCPEGIFLIYAINKIGARYCAFDCRAKGCEIRETLDTFSPKLCVVPTFQIKDFSEVYDYPIVYINITHSLGAITKFLFAFADYFQGRSLLYSTHNNFISYGKLIKQAKTKPSTEITKSSDDIFGYFYTSGTTYGRKSIILTNENINSAISQQVKANPYIESGNTMLNIMPLFTCYSVTLGTHLPLTSGVCVNLIPLVDTKKFKEIIVKNKPNYIITVPSHWEHFINDNFDNCDLSFFKTVSVGGDAMSVDFQEKISGIFEKCGYTRGISVGYGLSETTSTATVRLLPLHKSSVGKPLSNTLIGIFDRDTMQPLGPGEKGEICICGPTVCKGYYNDEKMTDMLLRTHADGNVWLHSGDCGYLDETGNLYFCERIKRMYVRYDGTKISPYSIELILSKCPIIKECMLIAIRDTEHSHGMCGKAIIVLDKNVAPNSAKAIIDNYIKKHLDEHMVPSEIEFVDKIPHTKNGKRDYFSEQVK